MQHHYIANQSVPSSSGRSLPMVNEVIYESVLERLGHAFENLRVGPATMDLDLGPLICQSQQQRVWNCRLAE